MRWALFLIFLAGCAYKTPYENASVQVPANYSAPEGTGVEEDLAQWWNIYDNPVLTSLIEEGIANSPELHEVEKKVEAARYMWKIEGTALWPHLFLDGEWERFRRSQSLPGATVFGPAVNDLYDLQFEATWEIDVFGKLRARTKAAYDQYLADDFLRYGMQVALIAEIARIYGTYWAAYEEYCNWSAALEVQEALKSLVERKEEAELVSARDKADIEADIAWSRAYLARTKLMRDKSIEMLAQLLGRKESVGLEEEVLKGGSLLNQVVALPQTLPSELLRRRPDILASEKYLAANSQKVKEAVADLFPRVSLFGTLGVESDSAGNLLTMASKTWSLVPQFLAPLFEAGKRRYRISMEEAREAAAFYQYEKTVINAFHDVQISLFSFVQTRSEAEEFSIKHNKLTEAFHLEEILFNADLLDFPELLRTKRRAIESRNQTIEALLQHYISVIQFYKGIGGGWTWEN